MPHSFLTFFCTIPRRVLTVAVSLLLFAPSSLALAADSGYHRSDSDPGGTYRIDPDHSSVIFSLGHAGVATAVGRFDKIRGHYRLAASDSEKTRVVIEIMANSVDTNHAMRDKDLRGPDFLDAKTFPTIRFVGTRYQKTGPHSGILFGDLSLHGRTKPLSFKVTEVGAGDVSALPKPWGGYLTGYEATATIRRSDFGITTYPSMIGDQVQLSISLEGIRTAK